MNPNEKIILIITSDAQKIIQQCLVHGVPSYVS